MNSTHPKRTQADVRRSAWPGWIWSVPLAAFGVAGWLGIRALAHGGETVTVTFDNAYGMKPNDTIVTLRGVKVGDVSDVALAPDGRHVRAELKIDRAEKQYLRSGTKFFLRGAQADLSDPSSMKALLSGPEIVMEPGPGKPENRFDGGERRPALTPQHGPIVIYALHFSGAAGELKDGADVELRGFHVGTVTSVHLSYDARTGALSTPVQIALDPSQLGIVGVPPPANGDWRPLVNSMIERLIAAGLRARLSQDPPLVGPRKVTLDFVADASSATLASENGVPVIPSVAAADFDAIASRASDVIGKVSALPIKETGEQVRSLAARINALSASPQIRDSLKHIDQAVTQIDRTLQQVSPQIGPLVAQLRETANAAEHAVAAADRTLGGDAASQNDLPAALRELTDTARSVRSLADYLDRHPEALVRGRREEHP
ncbi:MCE family protein [Paraburkholderia sp. LEh10]|uniref:MlaD family protein n=1 Tax=Paraburkholderia sp. LEh10 TaxID=2821353 RepID=UPI001AE5E1C3|nr:MlaD family protein [Paraburkholderia sp. LEh10]MBP0590298.1 MCE family protein [Paraburkholderia sp. LEh10]